MPGTVLPFSFDRATDCQCTADEPRTESRISADMSVRIRVDDCVEGSAMLNDDADVCARERRSAPPMIDWTGSYCESTSSLASCWSCPAVGEARELMVLWVFRRVELNWSTPEVTALSKSWVRTCERMNAPTRPMKTMPTSTMSATTLTVRDILIQARTEAYLSRRRSAKLLRPLGRNVRASHELTPGQPQPCSRRRGR